jgi:hypothetical protein
MLGETSEEQKHGANLGRYLDGIGKKRIQKDWGDTLFRKVRHLNTSMESWTLVSAGRLFRAGGNSFKTYLDALSGYAFNNAFGEFGQRDE